jgi:endonuclease III
MRKGTRYARKLKQVHAALMRGAPAVDAEESTDPTEQLIIAVLSQETPSTRARKALKRINRDMADYNELRVSTPAEISESVGQLVPRSVHRAKELLRLLNAVFRREYVVSLEMLRNKGVRETRQYLESLDGATPYVVASVVLWSFGGHAVPVNDVTLVWLVKQGAVDPQATAAEAHSFLDHHIPADEDRAFALALEAQAAARSSPVGGEGSEGESSASGRSKAAVKGGPRAKSVRSAAAARSRSPRTAKKGAPAGDDRS